jgi:phosphate transport system protein
MRLHFQRDLDAVKKRVFLLAGLVENSVRDAVYAVERRDADLAREVIAGDARIDDAEVAIEEECLKVLALHQPVAGDLRFLVAIIKITNDLERIGDYAVNIAERAAYLAWREPVRIQFDFNRMADRVQAMFRRSLDALVNMNESDAEIVCAVDDEVDAMNREMYELVKRMGAADPRHLDALLHHLSISRHLERIADHAVNIAVDVIYMISGTIVRHHAEDFIPRDQARSGNAPVSGPDRSS